MADYLHTQWTDTINLSARIQLSPAKHCMVGRKVDVIKETLQQLLLAFDNSRLLYYTRQE